MAANKIERMISLLSTCLALSIVCISFFHIPVATAWTPPSSPTTIPKSASSLLPSSRNDFLRHMIVDAPASILLGTLASSPRPANAAPPFAIMAEEMGYFPIKDERSGETLMVPAKAKRSSTDQAIALAKYLQSSNTKMYGAFWCPHCQRQKELFGKEAWTYITYVECSPKGYKGQYATCLERGVDGYPTWKFGNGKEQGGEMELVDIAKMSGYLGKKNVFDASLETGVPTLGGGSCQ